MDQAAEGMMEALKPNARGGIWVRVLEQGRIRVDDTLETVRSVRIGSVCD